MDNIWLMVFIAWVVVFVIMTKLWYFGKKIKNYAIVDVGWAFSLVAITFVYYFLGEGFIARKSIIMFMVFFWGFRLTVTQLIESFLQIYFSFKVYSTLSFRFHFLLFVQIQILTFIRLNI